MSQSSQAFYYSSQSSAFNINENQFTVHLTTSDRRKFIASILDSDMGKWLKIDNQTQAVSEDELAYCQFNPVLTEPNILTLTGCLGQGDYQLKFAVPSAEYLIKNIILYQLEQLNIHYTGKSIKAIKLLPKNSILLTSHDSASLATLVRHMMTISDNLYAQTLIRRLGYQLYQRGTFATGKKAVLEILSKQLGLDDTHIQFEDGAGLSENDLLTANYLVNLLYYTQNKSSFSSFYNALPVAGESGTLVKRFSNKLKGKVVAKTGSLSTVLTLSGYLTLNTGKNIYFPF